MGYMLHIDTILLIIHVFCKIYESIYLDETNCLESFAYCIEEDIMVLNMSLDF